MSGSIAKALETHVLVDEEMGEIEVILEPDDVEAELEALAEEAAREVANALPHDANLVLAMDDAQMTGLSAKVITMFDEDDRSRADWKEIYNRSLRLLGIKEEIRTSPWPNACGVVHPMITEAVIRFQSTTIMDMFPISGPYKAVVRGPKTDELTQAAERLKTEMNWITTRMMPEYRTEVEQGLWRLGTAGMSFRKVWMDPFKRRPVASTIAAEDIVVPYGAAHIYSSPRVTHIIKLHRAEVDRLMASGHWFEHDLPDVFPEYSDSEQKEGEQLGLEPTNTYDPRFTFYEMQIDLDLPGFEHIDDNGVADGLPMPYIITVEKSSQKVMAVRRNWREGDPTFSRINHYTAMCYIPGWGFYGIGLLALMAGLARGATSSLRQLVDAGTLNNLPAGFKGKGLRTRNDNTPLRPGEFRDVEIYGGKIADHLYQMNTKEPSAVLAGLMEKMVEEGRRLGAIAELPVKTGEMPVGTIVALIEHQTKPQSAVQARIYASFTSELEMIYDLRKEMGGGYLCPDLAGHDFEADARLPIGLVPVADPTAASSSIRILQAQAITELAARAPTMYDQRSVHHAMLVALGVGDVDTMLPDKTRVMPMDPIAENMALINGQPVRAGQDQDHKAHLRAHMAMMQDPRMAAVIGQNPQAQMIQAQVAAHMAEHAAFLHREQVLANLGFPIPSGQLPAGMENMLAPLIADAADRAAIEGQAKAAQQKNEEATQDPIVQLQAKDLEIREQAMKNRFTVDMEKVRLEAKKIGAKTATDAMKVQNDQRMAGAQIVEKFLSKR
jgi:hypothetical protein